MRTGIPLTNINVPNAVKVAATRSCLLGVKNVEAFMLTEDTAWFDPVRSVIFYAEAGRDITDFSSTPFGDGQEGCLRFAGRLHDLMAYATPVLVPNSQKALSKLVDAFTQHEIRNTYITVAEIIELGFKEERLNLSIWEAAPIYNRILVSCGFPKWRAKLYRTGLRLFQRFYRWVTAGSFLELASDPTWRDRMGYYKNKK